MIMRIDCYGMIILSLGTMEKAKEYLEKGLEAWRTTKDVQVKREAQTNSPQVCFWASGAVCAKIAAQVTYGLGFG
jgi:hypothetical protein